MHFLFTYDCRTWDGETLLVRKIQHSAEILLGPRLDHEKRGRSVKCLLEDFGYAGEITAE
jgi:hypothetical protein